jgi:hypothetical protein
VTTWRLRLALWVVLGAAGWLGLSWAGIAPGLAAAIAVELALTFRWSGWTGPRIRRRRWPDPGDPAGVREPRRPRPSGGAGAEELPGDPVR